MAKYVLHDSSADNPETLPIRLAAAAAGVELKVEVEDPKVAKSKDYRYNVNPLGKFPALSTPQGYLFGIYGPARYIASLGQGEVGGRILRHEAEISQWINFATNEVFSGAVGWAGKGHNREVRCEAVKRTRLNCAGLNSWLEIRTYLVADRLTLADIAVVSALYPVVQSTGLDDAFRASFPHLTRWLRTCFHQQAFRKVLGGVVELPAKAAKGEAASEFVAAQQEQKKGAPAPAAAKKDAKPKEAKQKEAKPQKEGKGGGGKKGGAPPVDEGAPLDLRVGLILKAEKHPTADSMYVEQIDLGEESGPRTICSGLVKHMSAEALNNRLCVVWCNLKPRPLRGIESNGMVMCSEDDAGAEPVFPPEGAVAGDRITLAPHDKAPLPLKGPIKTLVSSKKLPDILAGLRSDGDGNVLWEDAKWEVVGKGLCRAKHKNGLVK